MDIYVVQTNDTIEDIANKFGVSVQKLIRDNDLENPSQLVPGQTIVIVYPEQTYIVQEGDTLQDISEAFDVSTMQLLRNNPHLCNRKLTPGEVITIRYQTIGELTTNGYAYPFIRVRTLIKSLPNLTYLTIYNYKATITGELLGYYDDTYIIQTAKNYGTIPLMMLTSYSLKGKPDPDTSENILNNLYYQENFINAILETVISRGYLGINYYFDYLRISNLEQYYIFIKNISKSFENTDLLFFITINPNIIDADEYIEDTFEKVDYNLISQYVNNISYLEFNWGINYGPPAPSNSIDKLRTFTDYVITSIPLEKLTIGYSLISYAWKLPYIPGKSFANSLSINDSLKLALETNSIIQFDNVSQAPFFSYILESDQYILWTIDARSISAYIDLIIESGIHDTSFWNLMFYYAQLWLIINSQYDVVKYLPDNLTFTKNSF